MALPIALYRHADVINAGLFALAGGLGMLAAGPRLLAQPQQPAQSARTAGPRPATDIFGDPLPRDARARMGSLRWRHHEEYGNQLLVVPSPTGRQVATAAIGVGVIRITDLADGRRLCDIPWEKVAGYEVRFTHDGTRLIYLAECGVVRFFDPATGKLLGETKPVVGQDVPRRVRGNPDVWNDQWTTHQLTTDGRCIVTAHPEGGRFTLLLNEVPANLAAVPRPVKLDPPPGYGQGLAVYQYVTAGDTLIGAGRDMTAKPAAPVISRWNLTTGRLAKTTRIDVQENGFALSPDGRRLITWKGGLRVWDTESGSEAAKLEQPAWAGINTRFSPDGTRLLGSISDPVDETARAVTVWDLGRGAVVARVRVPSHYFNPFLLPDGRTLLAAGRGLMLSTWDLATGRRLSPETGHEDWIRDVAFSPDGDNLYTASQDSHERVAAWQTGTGVRVRELADAPGGYSRIVSAGDGRTLVTGAAKAVVWVDAASGRALRRFETAPLAAAAGERDVQVELFAGRVPETGRPAVFGYVSTAGFPKLLARWDAQTGELLFSRRFPGGTFDRFAAFSPDGRFVARMMADLPAERGGAGGDQAGSGLDTLLGRQAVVLEDALTGSSLLRLSQPDYLQNGSVAFTPDGQALVTWTSTYPPRGPDGTPPGLTTVHLWEVRSGKERLAFALPVVGKRWEFEPRAIAVSADGRLLAGARPDKTISVWDLSTGAEVAKRAGYATVVGCLAFRSDGEALASAHADGTAVVWDLSGVTPHRAAPANRDATWKDLTSDNAGTAYRAILALAADPGCAAFLRNRIGATVAARADQVRQLIADLDSPVFATRERATAGLARLGDAADDQLRAALAGALSAEQRRRVMDVLGSRGLIESDPDRLRALRCVEVLERSGSAEARMVLSGLSKGAPMARLTRDAVHALRRLSAAQSGRDQ